MKKYVNITLLLSISFILFPLPACKTTRVSPHTGFISLRNEPSSTEELFDFPPDIPPSQTENVWDVSSVDVSAIDKSKKLIAFTFDDSPARELESILSVFTAYNEANPDCPASATLFCNGNLMSDTTFPTLHALLTLRWELANHTYSHPDLTTLSDEDIKAEIAKTEEKLSKIDGKTQHLFRPPFGRIGKTSAKSLTVPVINWSIDTLDWTGVSAEEIYQTVFTQKESGAIVLMHDGYPNTVEALKKLLPDLKNAGYQVTSVSQMAKVHNCPLKYGSTYIRARKKGAD
ncbi:MAG: hypothetical protein E7368_04155 [Clostridiales bacterium]|nr:hypothetical protein [Clostridiales bacterium]